MQIGTVDLNVGDPGFVGVKVVLATVVVVAIKRIGTAALVYLELVAERIVFVGWKIQIPDL